MKAVLKEVWSRVELSNKPRLALVLDVSESADAHWPHILRLALDFLERVPEKCRCLIYFLGDDQPYTKDTLCRESARLYDDHRGRVSVISPLLEGSSEEQETVYIVLCAGRIYDLEDWVGTPFAERLALANFGELPVGDANLFECKASVEQIFESPPLRLQLGTPMRVEISGEGVMPFYWDNPAYTFNNRKLVSESTNEWDIMFGALCLDERDIQATVLMPGNRWRAVGLTTCFNAPEVIWHIAIPRDAARFRQIVKDGKYDCDLGPHTHSDESLRYPCDERTLLGRYIYSFLTPLSGSGFILVCDDGADVRYSARLHQALRMGDDIVVVRSAGMTGVYKFRSDSSVWQRAGHGFDQYQLVGDRTYAIAI